MPGSIRVFHLRSLNRVKASWQKLASITLARQEWNKARVILYVPVVTEYSRWLTQKKTCGSDLT